MNSTVDIKLIVTYDLRTYRPVGQRTHEQNATVINFIMSAWETANLLVTQIKNTMMTLQNFDKCDLFKLCFHEHYQVVFSYNISVQYFRLIFPHTFRELKGLPSCTKISNK
jgi:hypothetical protein